MQNRDDLDHWFVREILPLEPTLVRFLRNNWQNESEVDDLRQEIYLRIYQAAGREKPSLPKAFLFQAARNLMIDRLRHRNVVPIETIANLEELDISADEPTPEQHVAGRQQIRLLQAALDDLPANCREILILRKVQGLPQREVARLLGLSEETVESQLARAVRLLATSLTNRRGLVVGKARRFSWHPGLQQK